MIYLIYRDTKQRYKVPRESIARENIARNLYNKAMGAQVYTCIPLRTRSLNVGKTFCFFLRARILIVLFQREQIRLNGQLKLLSKIFYGVEEFFENNLKSEV